jgi:hypothetical protein
MGAGNIALRIWLFSIMEDIAMAPRKKTARYQAAPPSKAPKRPAAKTKALAITDPVRREAIPSATLPDDHLTLLRVILAYSPVGILAAQAAFWKGLASPKD